MKRIAIYRILFVVPLFLVLQKSIAQKTDTIIHINGNVLTGELKKMVYGVATWKMDGMGTISIEEPEINTIKSEKLFEIKMKNGLIHFGSFDTSRVNRKVNIVTTESRMLVNIEDIVEIYPLSRSFWQRTTGNFSFGGNFSKGGNVGNIATSGNMDYRKRKSLFSISWDDNNTFQGDSLSSTKADFDLSWQRSLGNKWSFGLSTGLSQNTELGYKRKIDFNAIGIRDISYNDWNRFSVSAGFAVTSETPFDNSGTSEDLTGLVKAAWKVFKYTSPKVWVNANVSFLPYITGGPRYRTNLNLNPQVSLFSNNFKVGINFYYNHDSKPPSAGASKIDYGTTLQLTYTLH